MNTILNSQKVVAHPDTGELIALFTKMDVNGEEKTYGKVRIDEETLIVNSGFSSAQKRTAFVTLDDSAIKMLLPFLKEGLPYPLEGKVVVKETFHPQYEGQSPKINPTTEEYIKVDGKLVYRSTEFTTVLDAKDIILKSSTNELNTFKEQVIDDELVM